MTAGADAAPVSSAVGGLSISAGAPRRFRKGSSRLKLGCSDRGMQSKATPSTVMVVTTGAAAGGEVGRLNERRSGLARVRNVAISDGGPPGGGISTEEGNG